MEIMQNAENLLNNIYLKPTCNLSMNKMATITCASEPLSIKVKSYPPDEENVSLILLETPKPKPKVFMDEESTFPFSGLSLL